MRLLSFDPHGRINLTSFIGSQIPKYAILSHTWYDGNEDVTFQDLKDLKDLTKKSGYRKIQFCAKQAQNDGLQYFWVDSCCIDKTSSAELSEAINSMFTWYRKAEICYVYLSDVSTNAHSEDQWQASFKCSRWFTRGWTLQELLAPRKIDFFSQEGKILGDKDSLNPQISQITGIPLLALEGSRSQCDLEMRISWMAHRATTIEEDFAYCLLGLLDVHIPQIYGEGIENAFVRVLDEINRRANIRNTQIGVAISSLPLLLAAKLGIQSLATLLLEAEIDISLQDESGQTALSLAAETGRLGIVKQLLQAEAQVNTKSKDLQTPLLLAAKFGHEAVVKELLWVGALIDSMDTSDRTALSWAALAGYESIVQTLLDYGANVEGLGEGVAPKSIPGGKRETPLILAVQNGHEAVVRHLLKAKARLDSVDRNRRTALSMAAMGGYTSIIEELLDAGAHIEGLGGNDDETPLILAARNGHEVVVNQLLQAKARVNVGSSVIALSLAAMGGYASIVKRLLDAGAYVDGIAGRTPISLAARNGHEAVVKLLLEAGAELAPQIAVSKADIPLWQAAFAGHDGVVKQLIEAGVDFKICLDGSSSFDCAATREHYSVLKVFLESSVDVRLDHCKKHSLLLKAVQKSYKAAVQALIEVGAPVNASDGKNSAILLADPQKSSYESIMKLLLNAGADPTVKDKRGRTALEIAKRYNNKTVIELLEAAIALKSSLPSSSKFTTRSKFKSLFLR